MATSIYNQPPEAIEELSDALVVLAKLEATSNAIRLRISQLAPDQLYRSVTDDPPIAGLISQAVDRERAYLSAFEAIISHTNPRLAEPESGLIYLDRDLHEDLATFFDLRRRTLNILQTCSDEQWQRTATLPNGSTATLIDLATRLQRYDAYMLNAISKQRRAMIRNTGVNDLRDMGVAGKLSPNIAQ